MTLLVGVWGGNLRSKNPRGVQRVAREISIHFSDTDAIRYIAIETLDFVYGRIVALCHDLTEFLYDETIGPGFYLDLNQVQVILSFECYEDIWTWPLRDFKTKFVCVVHDLIPMRIEEEVGVDRTRYLRQLANAVDKADLLICVSKATELDLTRLFPLTKDKSIVIYNGQGNDVLEMKTRFMVQPTRSDTYSTVAMVGTVEHRKNHLGVILAMTDMASTWEGPPLRLVCAGQNSADLFGTRYKESLDEAWLRLPVEFTDYIDDYDLASLYAQSSVVAFPSFWEGFGIPMLEAMAFGVPIVASDTSSMPEIAREHAYYCDPYDVSSIKLALCQALSLTPEQRRQRGEEARTWALQFSWIDFAKDYAAALASIGSGQPAAPALVQRTSSLLESFYSKAAANV